MVAALQPSRSRVGYFAWAAVLAQALLRLNTPEVGALFDRLQHMLPILAAPALAGFVLRFGGTRKLAVALIAAIGLYVGTSFVPVPHLPELRAWDPPLIDRVASADGNMILFEVNPHRDMDSDPVGRTPQTPFNTHFEGLLPGVAGQRFYSQMIDGWVWNVWRGQVVGGGTFRGRAIAETPVDDFVAEMRRWGVRHLFVWTDASRRYLAESGGRFVERWRGGRWSQFEMSDADLRSVVVPGGSGSLRNLDFLGGDVALSDAAAGDLVVVRTNYYPAWRAFADGRDVPLLLERRAAGVSRAEERRLHRPARVPRYRGLSIFALLAFAAGTAILWRWPRHVPGRAP